MNTWLITGGAGFIGSNFLRLAFKTTDVRLVILDALTYAGNIANIEGLLDSARVVFIKGDINDLKLIENIFKKYQITKVIHFAAESHVDRSILGPKAFIKTNIEGTFALLETVRKFWTDLDNKLFLHISTDEVFGSLNLDDHPFSEKSLYCPNSPYSASKAAADHLVRAWHYTYGLPVIVTNCSNNYGPWQFPEKMIPLMILNAIAKKPLPVYGDGMQIRDWLHVEDHCSALLTVLEKGKIGETYTIGGNNQRSNLEIIHQICKIVDEITNKPVGYSKQLIRHINDRPGHDRRYAIDSTKIQRELGWRLLYNMESALKDVVNWYIEHKTWVDSVKTGEYLNFYQLQYYGKSAH